MTRCSRYRGRALARYRQNPERQDAKVQVIGTGAYHISSAASARTSSKKELDTRCVDALTEDRVALTRYSIPQLAGAKGVEFLTGGDARRPSGTVRDVYGNYHIPISNTAAATLILECRSTAERRWAA